MGKIFSIFRLQLVILVVGVGIANVSAQTIQYLNSNNIVAGIAIGGNLFSDSLSITPTTYVNTDLFETKFDSGRAEIYNATLWISALDEGGNLHGAAQGYTGHNYFDGPIASTYGASYYKYYNRVFKVIQTKISQFRSLAFPVNSNQVDSSILYWPAKGNSSVLSDYGVSIDSPLAPYVDVNGNGIYDPLQGDYPAFSGDQAIFFVFNDVNGINTASDCEPLGVEIRGLATSFNDTAHSNIPYNKRAINNSIFVQYEIEDKSQATYTNLDLGQWLDPDIGCFSNDFVGCDSSRSLMFAYNGTAYDPSCSSELGFDSLPVALGVQILSKRMDAFGYFESGGAITTSDPTSCAAYRNFLEGYWGDGTPFEFGGNGYNSGNRVTKFLLSGDPTDTAQWSEMTNNAVPGDRRMFAAVDSFNFIPGQTIHFDVAFTTSFDSTSNNISIVDSLKKDADTIRNFYLQHILPARQVLAIQGIPSNNPFAVSVYPNPAHNQVNIIAGENIEFTELTDITGRVIMRRAIGAKSIMISVSDLAKGVYLVNVQSGGNTVIKKIVIE